MSDREVAPSYRGYPEKPERRTSGMERVISRLAYFGGAGFALRSSGRSGVAAGTAARSLKGPGDDVRDLRYQLHRSGLQDKLVERALSLIARQTLTVLGTAPKQAELLAARMLIKGRVVELPELQSWTLASAIAAIIAVLAGMPAHVIASTGYMARRDADTVRPLIESLGLTVGCVDESQSESERREIYASDIVYCMYRQVALDYLRDRLILKGRPRALQLRTEVLTSRSPRTDQLLLRGLQFAIVLDAEMVLVDMAQTPLSISADGEASQEVRWLGESLQLAADLVSGRDFQIHEDGRIELSELGRENLAAAARMLPGVWQGARRREEIVKLALVAGRVLKKDMHYAVSEGALQITEEEIRAHAPDAAPARLLRLLLEVKEECRLTGTRETLARIGYQRFFRRYLRLSALVTDSGELGPEIWRVFGLRVLPVASGAPSLLIRLPSRVYRDHEHAATEVVARVRDLRGRGCPVLIVTRTHQACRIWAELLQAQGIDNVCLMGSQDEQEAAAFAALASLSRITIAPHFAARGALVEPCEQTQVLGGLRVIVVQLLPTQRHTANIVARCIPKGLPGSVQELLALDDELIMAFAPAWWRWTGLPIWRNGMLRHCQKRGAREQAEARSELLRMEDYLGDVLAFTGGSF